MAERSKIVVWILLLYSFLNLCDSKASSHNCTDVLVKDLNRKPQAKLVQPMLPDEDFIAVCIQGYSYVSITQIWSSVKITHLAAERENIQLYFADSCVALYEAKNPSYAKKVLSWIADLDVFTSQEINLSPFGISCFGIQFPEKIRERKPKFELKPIYWHYPLSLIIGLILFWEADRLSRSVTFYYGSGIVLGVVVSLLIVVFILHRLVPSKGGAYMLLAGGWSMSLFVLQWTWNNLVDLVLDRNPFVISYFLLAGLVSFGLCYYNGPVQNARGLDLIRWTIQCIAGYLIYKGVQPETLSVAAVIVVAVTYFVRNAALLQKLVGFIPNNLISYRVRYFFFPPDLTLLSADEYEAQGEAETRRALQELRDYCNSPDCQAWKMMSRIKDPKRLSTFVMEGHHITDDEYTSYEVDPFTYERPSDDGD